MSGAIFGAAGLFPADYMTALVSGQALGGIFTALAFILVLAFGFGPNTTAFTYFTIGSLLIMLSIITYAMMTNQAFYKYYFLGENRYVLEPSALEQQATGFNAGGVVLEPNVREVFSKVYSEAVTICLLYTATLSVYPGVTVLMQSQNFGSHTAWSGKLETCSINS